MGRLTEDLLALARVESGEKRFELETVTPETCSATPPKISPKRPADVT